MGATPTAAALRGSARARAAGSDTPSHGLAALLAERAVTPLLAIDLPIRGVVCGPTGSGKSAAVAALLAELRDRGLRFGTRPTTDVDVVVVDDADDLPDDALAEVTRFAEDPDASVVLAHLPRPGPRLRAAGALLEKACPPALLGEVDPDEIVETTRIPLPCAHAIVEQTGGLTWLTLAAVDAHDPGLCATDPTHGGLARTLRAAVAHRLETLGEAQRAGMDALCTLAPEDLAARPVPGTTWDDVIAVGYARGLLAPNGTPPPLVRAAVCALVPAHRRPEGASADPGTQADRPDPGRQGPAGLVARADRIRAEAPAQAASLYRHVASLTGRFPDVALAAGIAAFQTGDLDAAGAAFDELLPLTGHPHRSAALDASVAVWGARGVLEVGASSYAGSDAEPAGRARAALIALALRGRADAAPRRSGEGCPDTLTVASDAWATAMADSASDDVTAAVDDLVVASELYSATHSDFPLVEPPAVVAAMAALATGRTDLAASALESALRRRQGGIAARPRLLLWRAWVAIHTTDAAGAASCIAEADAHDGGLAPRDRLIRAVCQTALARRYASTPELVTTFRAATHEVHQQRFDLFLFPFLGELSLAAARTDEPEVTGRALRAAFDLLERAGQPPLWSAPLHWIGIQRGILLGRPELLPAHAHALLAAAERNPFAARLAVAGRVWTDVLAGRVDVGAVQASARELAAHGLAWDGARLAAHGAARTTERTVYAQLLACARELHPPQALRATGQEDAPDLPSGPAALSPRESDVARLVLEGKTYIEIGQALFISPRTAEHHIARIRRRVDATSRSDLLAKLRGLLGDDTPKTSHIQEGT